MKIIEITGHDHAIGTRVLTWCQELRDGRIVFSRRVTSQSGRVENENGITQDINHGFLFSPVNLHNLQY